MESKLSEGMECLLENERLITDTLRSLEQQIHSMETSYLEDTSHGNVALGWEGFLESKPNKKDPLIKKIGLVNETTRIFSQSATCWNDVFQRSDPLKMEIIKRKNKSLKKRKRDIVVAVDDINYYSSS